MTVTIKALRGDEMLPLLDELARLRITIFADYPYLYDGDPAYEAWYLEKFSALDGAIVVAAIDEGKLIGAATGSPLAHQFEDFSDPLKQAGYAVNELFYCGESLLLAAYRGQGFGHVFFDEREAQARQLGLAKCCFLSVIRDKTDARQPQGYRDLHGFWQKRGYKPIEGVTAGFAWKEHGCRGEQEHRLQYWMRDL